MDAHRIIPFLKLYLLGMCIMHQTLVAMNSIKHFLAALPSHEYCHSGKRDSTIENFDSAIYLMYCLLHRQQGELDETETQGPVESSVLCWAWLKHIFRYRCCLSVYFWNQIEELRNLTVLSQDWYVVALSYQMRFTQALLPESDGPIPWDL